MTSDDWVLAVKPGALHLPHAWFAWLQLEEQAAGFEQLGDPKLDGNPIMDASWQLLTSICLGPLSCACLLLT